jgi:hypothetical protein
MHRTIIALAALAAVCWQPNPSPAQAQSAVTDACTADYQKLCPGVAPGGGRVLKCFQARQSEVSARCLAALREARARSTASTGN